MKKLIILALVLVSLAGYCQSVNVPFKVCPKSSLLIVGVNLNGHYTSFLVDCGSELTIVDRSQKKLFGFTESGADDEGSSNSDWSGHSVDVSNAVNATIEIGTLHITDGIRIADVRKLLGGISATVCANVTGIIGSNTLRQNGLVIDYRSMSLHN